MYLLRALEEFRTQLLYLFWMYFGFTLLFTAKIFKRKYLKFANYSVIISFCNYFQRQAISSTLHSLKVFIRCLIFSRTSLQISLYVFELDKSAMFIRVYRP